jgi:alkanesulfonate monooxygenase SsuD/methylene tetrahydromethanopterin reductase-like flavin-dependent oxidoreductase (luciferase family)
MRLGAVLGEPFGDDAVLLEDLGYDVAWIVEADACAPLLVAANVAPRTSALRLAACVAAGPHPVALAEDAAMADLASGGRLILAVGGDDASELGETVDVLNQAFAARPFAHAGTRWQIPARLPEHHDVPARLRVTPPPAQLELPVWLAGRAAPAVAVGRADTFVSDGPSAAAAAAWAKLEAAIGPAAYRLRRPGVRRISVDGDGDLDASELVRTLRAEQDGWGMDLAILDLPADLPRDARGRALATVARAVRPRLQLEGLPSGLERHWSAREAR